MNPITIIKKLPSGGPAGEIIKLVALFTATLLLDKVGEILEDSLTQKSTPTIDVKFEGGE